MTGLTYKDAGVNIDAGNQLVENIKPLAKSTNRAEVLGNLGGFAACVEIPKGYENPVLVSGTDGVGTKLKLAIDWQDTANLGQDLVAMCVNDLIVTGAEPLFFLDYYATGELNVTDATQIVQSIAKACIEASCSLVGGETAEMPGLYAKKDFDLAGFAVGVVEKSKIQTPEKIQAEDIILGLASSGAHSNGYSLIRKIIADKNITKEQELEAGLSLQKALLEPTKIYVKSLLPLLKADLIQGLCHITGGGFYENVPRIVAEGLTAQLDFSNFTLPKLFKFLQTAGNIAMPEMLRTFNSGIGMLVIVKPEHKTQVIESLTAAGEQVYQLGKMVKTQNNSNKLDILQMPN